MFPPNSSKFKALQAAEVVFKSLVTPKPIKYATLTTLAQAEGWCHTGSQKPSQVMYEALRSAIGLGDTRFTFHGRGYFSYTEHNISDNELPELISVQRLGRKKRQELFEQIYDKPLYNFKTCGDCQHIEFNGIKAVQLQSGICMHEDSGVCNTYSTTAACPLFFQRSDNQIKEDYENSLILKIALDKMPLNAKLAPRKRKETNLEG